MASNKFFGIIVFLLFLFSFASAETVGGVTVTDLTNQTENITSQQAQGFAQLNAKILDLTGQVSSLRALNEEFQKNAFMKSDLQNLYDNIVNINHQAEMSMLLNNIIMLVLAFALFFILIGKNLLPQHNKKAIDSLIKVSIKTELLKKQLEVDKIIASQSSVKKGWWIFKKKQKPVEPPETAI